MIRTEAYSESETLVRTYSDQGLRIKQDGTDIIYDAAIDPIDSGRTYTETDEPVEQLTAEQLLGILTGGDA